MAELKTLVTGLVFGEQPRWRDGRLWFSDWGTQDVMAADLSGNTEVMVHAGSFPCCSEVGVEPVAVLVPLPDPQVWERIPAEFAAQLSEEPADMQTEHLRVPAEGRPVRQSAQPVQPVRRAVPTNTGPGASRSYSLRSLTRRYPERFALSLLEVARIQHSRADAPPTTAAENRHRLSCIGVQPDPPARPWLDEFRSIFK
jgi:hypothetical protein